MEELRRYGRRAFAAASLVMKRIPERVPAILNCRLMPGRLSRRLTADILGLKDVDDVTEVVKAKLLKPMNAEGDQYWFFADDVLELARDRTKMKKITKLTHGTDNPND